MWHDLTLTEEQTSDSDDTSSSRSDRRGDEKPRRSDANGATAGVTDDKGQLLWHTIGDSGADKALAAAAEEEANWIRKALGRR